MSLLGTLLVVLLVAIVLLIGMTGILFDRINQRKREDLRRKREAAHRRSATVVSIEHKVDWVASMGRRMWWMYPQYDSDYYLMVEWTNPETQQTFTSPTRVMPRPCRYHPGDRVFIYTNPDMREVWLDEPRQRSSHSSGHGFFP